MRIFRRAMTTLSFSAICLVLPLRRMPAVSTKTYSAPFMLDASHPPNRAWSRRWEKRSTRSSSGERVQKRGFADIRAADDGHLDGSGIFSGGVAPRKVARDVVQQTRPRRCRVRPKPGKSHECRASRTRGPGAVLAPGVGLIDGERNGLAEPAQHLRQIAVGPVISLRPSTRKIIWSACSSATRACFRIWLGIYSSSFTTMPPVSISSNRLAVVARRSRECGRA